MHRQGPSAAPPGPAPPPPRAMTAAAQGDAKPRRQVAWLAGALSSCGLMADTFDISVINLVRPCLVAEYGPMRPGQEGVLMAATVAGAMFGQTVFGPLADAHGRRAVFVVTASVIGFASLGSALATPIGRLDIYDTLAFWRFLLGLGIGGEYPLSAANVAENVPAETSGQSLAAMLAGRAMGVVFGALVTILYAGVLHVSDAMLWRMAFGTGVVLAIVCATLRYCLLAETFAFQAVRTDGTFAETMKDEAEAKMGALAAMAPSLVGTAGCWFLFDVCNYGVGIFTTAIFPAAPGVDTAWTVLHILALSAPLLLLGVALSGIMRMRSLLLLGLGLQTLCFFGMAALCDGEGFDPFRRREALLLFALSRGFEHLGPAVAVFSMPAQIFPTRIRATAHGISAAAGKVGAVAGALSFPYMKASLGLEGVMNFMAVICVANIAWGLALLPSYGPQQLAAMARLERGGLPLAKQAVIAQRIMAGDEALSKADVVGEALPLTA